MLFKPILLICTIIIFTIGHLANGHKTIGKLVYEENTEKKIRKRNCTVAKPMSEKMRK